MGMTVKKVRDTRIPRVFQHKVADVRGGVGVVVSELGGDFLLEGTPLSIPDKGRCHVIKTAEVVEQVESDATEVKVKKFQHFKEGDFVMLTVGAKAVKVAKVDRSKANFDTITLEEALGSTIEKGKHLLEAKEKSESNTSELKYTPFALVGRGQKVVQGDNFDTDAVVIGVTRGANIPAEVLQYLKGIVDYN
jgi:hypothetical protein|nr:MAG TPA: Head fiber protein [Caudoviricetes sp.]